MRRLAVVAALAQAGCHVFAPAAAAPGAAPAPTPAAATRVELRRVDERPPIDLVARLGDPSPALAVAVAHDLGAEASTALAALIGARLRRFGIEGASAEPHQLGFSASALVATPDAARQFVVAADSALRSPVSPVEPALIEVRAAVQKLSARVFPGNAARGVDACSGELAVPPGFKAFDPTTPEGVARLEGWRQRVANAASVAFGALGAPDVLDAAITALAHTAAWPGGPGPDDPWPAHDALGVDGASDGARRLSIAFRLAGPGAAIEAARALGRPGSSLAARLGAFDPAWTLERVVGTTRPRGACLRVDALAPGSDAPGATEVARATAVIEEEARLALGRAKESSWTLDDSVLRATDPRAAAAVAAWRALAQRLAPGPTRELASYQTHPAEATRAASDAFARALDQVRAGWQQPIVERRVRAETGQGELWALVASRCATAGESSEDAGLTALVARALAGAAPRFDDVALEPWISEDGIGLLAHAPRRGPDETPAELARRVGAALGRVLVATRIDGEDVAAAREALLAAVGPGPRPGYWLAVDSVAPDHPSWLEPRGTFQSLSGAATHDVVTRRRQLLDEPLRLAVLANADAGQADALAGALERWLHPARGTPQACPAATAPTPRHGELDLETSSAPDHGTAAYVAVPLPAGAGLAATWTTLLFDRRGGWLDQALEKPGLASSARAALLGGDRARALVVEIAADPDHAREAVAQVRGLFDRLARGAVTAGDLAWAARRTARLDAAARLGPRRRIVDLWRGQADPAAPDLGALRRFHAEAFRGDAPVVVYVKER